MQMPLLGEVRVVSAKPERSKARAVAAIPGRGRNTDESVDGNRNEFATIEVLYQIYATANPFQRMRVLTLMTRLRPECEP